jgi:hypothetical protein
VPHPAATEGKQPSGFWFDWYYLKIPLTEVTYVEFGFVYLKRKLIICMY